jgi:hypothetical protein
MKKSLTSESQAYYRIIKKADQENKIKYSFIVANG